MPKKILKRGKLSKEDVSYITLNHRDMSVTDIAKELRRSVEQVDNFIKEDIQANSVQNKKNLQQNVDIHKVGVAAVMTEMEASKPAAKGKKEDSPWIFRQPTE